MNDYQFLITITVWSLMAILYQFMAEGVLLKHISHFTHISHLFIQTYLYTFHLHTCCRWKLLSRMIFSFLLSVLSSATCWTEFNSDSSPDQLVQPGFRNRLQFATPKKNRVHSCHRLVKGALKRSADVKGFQLHCNTVSVLVHYFHVVKRIQLVIHLHM